MTEEKAKKVTKQDLMRIDPFLWAFWGGLRLPSGSFSPEGRKYQVEPLQDKPPKGGHAFNPRVQVCMKATQTGWTEIHVIKCLHGMIHSKYPKGLLYLFPTRDDVTDFANSRFKPLISDNRDLIGKHLKDTDQANLKRVGKSYIYFRGARLSQTIDGSSGETKRSSRLMGLPVDGYIMDELDLMDEDAIALAKGRLEASGIKNEWFLSNPSIPDFGVHKLYQKSDRRVWEIKCGHCGTYTCLEREFLERWDKVLRIVDGGKVIKVCKKCEKEIFSWDGMWVPEFPDRSQEIVGRWLSHLNNPFTNLKELIERWTDPNLKKQTFYNLSLGLPYIEAENRLTENDVFTRCTIDPMEAGSYEPTVMGVDVGKPNYVVIGKRISERQWKILKLAKLSTFEDIYDLARRFKVNMSVFDNLPETQKVADFRHQVSFPVYGCEYREFQRGEPVWDEKAMLVTSSRTDLCDITHNLFTTPGEMELPRKSDEIKVYAKHLSALAKALETNEKTKVSRYVYKQLDDDHYYHATNYFYLASMRRPPQRGGRGQARPVVKKDSGGWT